MPLVSFIITTYNLPSEYLEFCLKSILQLSLNPKEREIIIVDDEQMRILSGGGTTVLAVERGYGGTTPRICARKRRRTLSG